MATREDEPKIVDANKKLKKSGLKIGTGHNGETWGWFVFHKGAFGRQIPVLLLDSSSTEELVDLAQRLAAPVYVPPVPRDVLGRVIEIGDTVAIGDSCGSTLYHGKVIALSEYVWIGGSNGRKMRRIPKRVVIVEKVNRWEQLLSPIVSC